MGGDGTAAEGTELAAVWIELAMEGAVLAEEGTELAVEGTELAAEGTELAAEETELVAAAARAAARKEGGVPSGPGITSGCRCTCRAEMTTASRWWYLRSAGQAAAKAELGQKRAENGCRAGQRGRCNT